jgi:lysophospholipase L1-like esterase
MFRYRIFGWAILCAMILQFHLTAADAPPTDAGLGSDPKGAIFLSTRGFARTTSDKQKIGLEAETLHRQEFPYGAAAGWRWVYQGYSDGAKDTINLKAAGVWIQQTPGAELVRLPLTFNGGASHVDIPQTALVETDPITTEIKPGAIVWVTTWYCAGTPVTGLPFQTLMCVRESKPGLEDQDGAVAGPVGSLTDLTLKGGFDHNALGSPLMGGQPYCIRGYQPMGAVGLPSPAFHGPEIVPLFLGDSINVQYIDAFDDKTIYSMRGWNGRFCASKYPYMIFGQGGAGSDGFLKALKTPLFVYILGDNGTQKRKVTHIFNEYGINEVRLHNPPDDVAAFEWAIRAKVAAVAHTYGVPYIQSTLMPCEARLTMWHTDSAADKAAFATFAAQRQVFNNMVRTQSDDAHLPGCVGFWDPCTVVETDSKAGNDEWVKAFRTDGIHPNSAGHAAAAGTISPDLLEKNPNPVPAQ